MVFSVHYAKTGDTWRGVMFLGSVALQRLQRGIDDAVSDAFKTGDTWRGVEVLGKIDALCIIQDEGMHKQSQIAQMASIYMQSLFTIIAVDGTHADAGLPGVRDGTRSTTTQDIVTTSTTSLIPLIDHLDYHSAAHHRISYSTWYTRGWTMQEQVFLTRKLIFAKDQVYWHCSDAKWVEETELEFGSPLGYQGYRFGQDLDPNNPKNGPAQDSDSLNFHYHAGFQEDFDFNAAYTALRKYDGAQGLRAASRYPTRIWIASRSNAAHLEVYRDLAIKYMNRCLTFESDRFNAFSGILTGLTALFGKRYIWALPESDFSFGLIWTMPGHHRSFSRHTRTLHDGQKIEFPLPSWSWLAWYAGEPFGLHMGDLGWTSTPEIVFYQWEGADGYRRIEGDVPDAPIKRDVVTLARKRRYHWKSTPTTIKTGQQEPFDEENDTGLLRFWTSTIPKKHEIRDSNSGGNGNGQLVIRHGLGESNDQSVTGWDELVAEGIVGDIVVISRRLDWDYSRNTIKDTELFALVVYWEDGIAYRLK
ncbi:HET-domain-containing protein [Periconia macrospinosa]|uniref:HET-domain-containing protein n=1 Tax=Periconia macrospinosa TaxID=97972 RepID=A0A2V1DFG1_9PLEO|nr:HET-domain-containing protein [Periconia macrospinosa]